MTGNSTYRGVAACLFAALATLPSIRATASAQEPFSLGNQWGDPAPYGLHPGIDYEIAADTPIIAVSNGKVFRIKETASDGASLLIRHGRHFLSEYAHLGKVLVAEGDIVKRGQPVGLSGASNNYNRLNYQHLHFALCRIDRRGCSYPDSLDPGLFWLDGKPQCFDPDANYAGHAQKDITLPVACGDHAERIRSAFP